MILTRNARVLHGLQGTSAKDSSHQYYYLCSVDTLTILKYSCTCPVHGIQKLRLLTILLSCVYAVELAYLIPTAPSLKLSAL